MLLVLLNLSLVALRAEMSCVLSKQMVHILIKFRGSQIKDLHNNYQEGD